MQPADEMQLERQLHICKHELIDVQEQLAKLNNHNSMLYRSYKDLERRLNTNIKCTTARLDAIRKKK